MVHFLLTRAPLRHTAPRRATPRRAAPRTAPHAPHHSTHDLCKTLHCTAPKGETLRSALINAGFRVSGSHANPLALKTDAPPAVVWDVMRCWVAQHPVKAPQAGSYAEAILAKPAATQADFRRAPGAVPKSVQAGVARFVQNPAFWGPKARHGRPLTQEQQKQQAVQAEQRRARQQQQEQGADAQQQQGTHAGHDAAAAAARGGAANGHAGDDPASMQQDEQQQQQQQQQGVADEDLEAELDELYDAEEPQPQRHQQRQRGSGGGGGGGSHRRPHKRAR
jgi:tRNA (guanine26-N2/guanine27-N2)-dimethyltransferase